jgi:hypothetical protein
VPDLSSNYPGEFLVAQSGFTEWSNVVGGSGTASTSGEAVPLIVKQNEEWSVLQEWKTYSDTTVASINSSGNITFTGNISATVAEPSANANTAKAVGYVGMPQNILASGGLTLSASHAGEHIYVTGTDQDIVIPANSSVPFEIGTTIVIINAADVTTEIATNDTLLLASEGTTGTRTLGPHGMATLVKITATSWIISGNGLS